VSGNSKVPRVEGFGLLILPVLFPLDSDFCWTFGRSRQGMHMAAAPAGDANNTKQSSKAHNDAGIISVSTVLQLETIMHICHRHRSRSLPSHFIRRLSLISWSNASQIIPQASSLAAPCILCVSFVRFGAMSKPCPTFLNVLRHNLP